MEKGTIILEGGANRGLFTAGVLDYLMDQEFYFSHVIGVSMGACNAIDYVSRQPERTKKCIITDTEETNYYYGPTEILKEKSIMNMDLIFDKLPNELLPFDYETYFKSAMKCEQVVTNCVTGKAEYLDEREDKQRLLDITRASCSMPLVTPMAFIDGVPYLDGGLADSIPIKRAMTYGNKKIVLILTRNSGYRKKPTGKVVRGLYEGMYKRYPALVKTLINRNAQYNRTLEKIEEWEKKGYIYVIRPEMPTISRLEKDSSKQEAFYQHGVEQMTRQFDEVKKFLKK